MAAQSDQQRVPTPMDARQQPHLAIITSAADHASELGVELDVEWQDEQERLTFVVQRRDGAAGAGEKAIAHLLSLADDVGVPVTIDVAQSLPALIRYYWRFGFRAFADDDETERRELLVMESERTTWLSQPGHSPDDYGVTFMWRATPPRGTMAVG